MALNECQMKRLQGSLQLRLLRYLLAASGRTHAIAVDTVLALGGLH